MSAIRPNRTLWGWCLSAALLGICSSSYFASDRSLQAQAAESPLAALQRQIAQLQLHQAGQDAVIEDLELRVSLLEEVLFGGGGDGGGGGGNPNGDLDQDGDGYTPNQGDCDDLQPTIYPGAPEIPDDGIDNDCDGTIDEEF